MYILEVGAFLLTAQLLTRHWLAALSGDDLGQVWGGFVPQGDFVPQEEVDRNAWILFTQCLNWGLRAVHVRAELPA